MWLAVRIVPEPAPDASAVPLVIYLPGISDAPSNSARRVADVLADKASEGPGTFAVEKLSSSYEALGDGARIIHDSGAATLDVLELNYKPGLLQPQATRSGLRGLFHQLLLALKYALWAVQLLWHARRRAKTRIAKAQLLIGLGSALTLLVFFVITFVAILVALGFIDDPVGSERLVDAVALGLTAVTTWLFVRVRPAIVDAAVLIEQLMDFVHDDRREGSVARKLAAGIDQVLETNPGRRIYVIAYSLGSLVAIAFAFPRTLLHIRPDERHTAAVQGVFTIGCPIDFVRLYVPGYLTARTPRLPDLRWVNIYIAADVLASNFYDGNDEISSLDEVNISGDDQQSRVPVTAADIQPTESERYTSETLTWRNIWSRRGFLSHGGYWDEPGNESCLRLVLYRLPIVEHASTPPDPTAA
jgi:hypothetical protein